MELKVENVFYSKADSPLADNLTEKFDGLFPTWTTVLATVLALLIIMVVLGPLVYRATKKMVDKRRKYIQDNIDQAENHNNVAQLDRREANQELMQARTSASDIISKAKLEAEEYKEANLSIAKDEAAKIIATAKDDMQREKSQFDQDSKHAIVEVALAAAAKVVDGVIDKKVNKKIIEDFIDSKK